MTDELPEENVREVTGEELLNMLKVTEMVSADRLVFIRAFERFYTTVDNARTLLLNDIQEVNRAITNRDEGLSQEKTDSTSEEE